MPEFTEIKLDRLARKKIMYEIDENECWNCTSHSTKSGDRSNSNKGYPRILYEGKTVAISRVILYQRCGFEFGSILHIHHKCENPRCINPEHLEIVTHEQHQHHTIREKSSDKRTKITIDDARKIRFLYDSGKFTQGAIARYFEIHHSQVSNIVNNKQWKELSYV